MRFTDIMMQNTDQDPQVRTRKVVSTSDADPLSPRRRRLWQQDHLREEDDFRMQNIVMDLRVIQFIICHHTIRDLFYFQILAPSPLVTKACKRVFSRIGARAEARLARP